MFICIVYNVSIYNIGICQKLNACYKRNEDKGILIIRIHIYYSAPLLPSYKYIYNTFNDNNIFIR